MDTQPAWDWTVVDDASHPPPTPTEPEAKHRPVESSSEDESAQSGAEVPPEPQSRQRYRPRTCRICLETVQPTFAEGSTSKPTYMSEDPDLGRLLSPCKCKGTQRYVHEGCLDAWRLSNPTATRNYWQCPTCKFTYRMARLHWAAALSSRLTKVFLTIVILFLCVFTLGFIADPIIDMWFDPLGTISDTVTGQFIDDEFQNVHLPIERTTWSEHFMKGFYSMGLIGFLKSAVAMSPLNLWNLRGNGLLGSGRRAGNGRQRMEDMTLLFILIGVGTSLMGIWKGVQALSARVLKDVSDRVLDVGDGNDDEEEEADEDVDEAGKKDQDFSGRAVHGGLVAPFNLIVLSLRNDVLCLRATAIAVFVQGRHLAPPSQNSRSFRQKLSLRRQATWSQAPSQTTSALSTTRTANETNPLKRDNECSNFATPLGTRRTINMQFAYRNRKNSNAAHFRPRSSTSSLIRRTRMRTILLILGAFLVGLFLLTRSNQQTPYREHTPSGKPPVVIVTVIDPTRYNNAYLKTIKENRELYAARHGYEAMVVKAFDYDTHGAPQSWAKLVAMRHALTTYPDAKFIWHLDQNSYIMDPTKTLEELVLSPKKLESLMIKDYPVVPPDSIIKTFNYLRGEDTDLVISQDRDGLISDSVILRNGDWAKYFVETWFDPLYRSYNFQKAERHALEHIVQWHPTILSRLALVPQRTIASYTRTDLGDVYQSGDFVVMFPDCDEVGDQSCEAESKHYLQMWRTAFGES
ncbi:alpha-1,2-galactosyltransferase [Paramyrothecium foliicola]|nr:alpha-1,2-galactosyltransferase [Paramyrothecium foliicola]